MDTQQTKQFPQQQLPISRKNKKWREACVDWAKNKTFFNHQLVRKSVINKKINQDLLNGKLHMADVERVLNPYNIKADFIPDEIQHYSLINTKIDLLRGEETGRLFDFRVIVTNSNALSDIEEQKFAEYQQRVTQELQSESASQEEFEQAMQNIQDDFEYNWQDARERMANCLLQHYMLEYNIPLLFNEGFVDALVNGEESYQIDIVGGEPVIYKLNPLKIRAFRSGYSNKLEDADVIIIEDYWSPSKILDVYYDVLSPKDVKKIEELPFNNEGNVDSMDNLDERKGYINIHMLNEEFNPGGEYINPFGLFEDPEIENLMPYDMAGNIRVLRVYWKSKRKIKRVKRYDPETGETEINFFDESYVPDETMGEESKDYWVSQAWEGTLIGDDIYVNIKPRPIQYNRLNNPSKCHFGIIGSIYNYNETRPFSLVDRMKPFNYLYDVYHDRLNKLLAKSWGKILKLDLAMIPEGWTVDQWMYFAKTNNIAVVNSFNEVKYGAGTGKLAGALNNNNQGYVDAELGQSIAQCINVLEYVKNELSDIVGISKQREGQVANRETVGGVERATLQSSYITEWFFVKHEDVKRRVIECLLETAKICFKGRNKKFQYILPDQSQKILTLDGNLFAEADYGLVVDNGRASQELNQKLERLGEVGLQSGALRFSSIMKLYSTKSLAEKQRMIEREERENMQMQQQQQQQQQQLEQEKIQREAQMREQDMRLRDYLNKRDNDTRVLVANLQSQAEKDLYAAEILQHADDPSAAEQLQAQREKIQESARQFDAKLDFEKDKLSQQQKNVEKDQELKARQISKMNNNRK